MDKHAYTNSLINESSPYLLQHAHNPVDWYPWGEEALEKAKKENKLVLVSVGYAACHWCHVMENESFEDTAVANYMNEHFICIKVDREERPDVDQIYMTAAQLMTGSGGWPLNALALPNGKPFFAGTYFPKEKWLQMLAYYVDVNKKNPAAVAEQARKVTEGIRSIEMVKFTEDNTIATINEIDKVFDKWKPKIDYEKGGENRAPKFPMPSNWEFLLQYELLSGNKDADKAVEVTLREMAYGGIYDQLEGGFARYSVDADWKVPHFEKMLYDNAQLVSLYSNAYKKTKNPLYKKVVQETLQFIENELTSPEGGFYSSLDADSDGVEGKYYVWTMEELRQILGADAEIFSQYYNVTNNGNWEHGNSILLRHISDAAFAKKHKIDENTLVQKIEEGKKKLLAIRDKRIKPRLDDKVLTSWTALMINGYADAYKAFGDEAYRKKAMTAAKFLVSKMLRKDGGLLRNYKNEKASIHGMLDDYAFTTTAFINMYEISFDESWLQKARTLQDYTTTHFYDEESKMYFYTHNDHSDLIARKMEVTDNVIPASNSEVAKNLYKLGLYFNESKYSAAAKQMVLNVQSDIHGNIRYYSNWAMVELLLMQDANEIAIVGNNADEIRKEMQKRFTPFSIYLGGRKEGSLTLLQNKYVEGKTMIYVCRNKTCKRPVEQVEEAIKLLN